MQNRSVRVDVGGTDVSVGLVHNVWWMEPKKVGPMYKHIE